MNYTQRLVTRTVLGGAGAIAGGGKFANGAITTAFGYLFNDELHNCTKQCGPNGADLGIIDPTSPYLEGALGLSAFGKVYQAVSWFFSRSTDGLPPPGASPPVEGPFTLGPASRRSDPGQSLWDPNGGEWRYVREDNYHNPHWDYNAWNHATDKWQNVQIGNLPPVK